MRPGEAKQETLYTSAEREIELVEKQDIDGFQMTTRTFSAREAVRLARERVQMNNSVLDEMFLENEISHLRMTEKKTELEIKNKNLDEDYRIQTGSKLARFVRDMFD